MFSVHRLLHETDVKGCLIYEEIPLKGRNNT